MVQGKGPSAPHMGEGDAHFLKNAIIPILFALLLLGYSLYVCVIPPQIGMADSGDYSRLMTTIGVRHSSNDNSEIAFSYFRQFYSKDEKSTVIKSIGDSFARFPASAFTVTSCLINALFGNTNRYNIVYPGIVYSIAYSFAFLLLTQSLARDLNPYCRILLWALAALIYADSLFVVYFNSFYQEPVFLISLSFCAAVLIRQGWKSPVPELSVFCLSLSKFQNIIFSALYSIAVFFGVRRYKLVTALLVLSLVITVLGSQRYKQPNIFHSYFTGLVMNNPEKDKVLSDFGLHLPEYSSHIGRGYWEVFHESPANKEISKDFYSKVSIFKIITYYLQHPGMLISNFTRSMDHIRTADSKPGNFGNYSKEYSAERKQYSGISFFSGYMAYLFAAIPLLSVISMLLSIFRKRPGEFFLTAILFALLPITVIISFVGEGFTDFPKHLFSFYAVLALLCVVSLGNLLQCASPVSDDSVQPR
ncbi:MAG: hypothetical protein AB9866_12520 [Syntrophobacteraceae bacterium]